MMKKINLKRVQYTEIPVNGERVSIYKVYASLESYETKLNSFKQVDKV